MGITLTEYQILPYVINSILSRTLKYCKICNGMHAMEQLYDAHIGERDTQYFETLFDDAGIIDMRAGDFMHAVNTLSVNDDYDVAKVLSICDKLCLSVQIGILIGLNRVIESPVKTIINHPYYDISTITGAHKNGYNLLFNGAYVFSDSIRNDFCDAIVHGNMRITKLKCIDNPCIDNQYIDITPILPSLYANLQSLDYCCNTGWNISQNQCKLLTSLNIAELHRHRNKLCMTNNDIDQLYLLESFNCDNNDIITTLGPFAKNLRVLSCSNSRLVTEPDTSDVATNVLQDCTSLEKFICNSNMYNGYIEASFDSFATSLKTLLVDSCNGTKDAHSIQKCINIEKISCNDYDYHDCYSYMDFGVTKTLRVLSVCGALMDDNVLKHCANIVEFDCSDNYTITTCAPFAKTLETLHACGSAMSDNGLVKCTKIKNLNCCRNYHITTCEPFANSLCKLMANYSGITDYGLKKCKKITTLICNSSRVTKCGPFIFSLKILVIKSDSEINIEHVHELRNSMGIRDELQIINDVDYRTSQAICDTYFPPISRHFTFP